MLDRVSSLARHLAEVSVRRPWLTVVLGLGLTAVLLTQAARLTSELGYAAYFGPDDPAVERLSGFFEEFDSGRHVLVVFGCPGSKVCSSVRERAALDFIVRLQQELDRLPNVRKTQSVSNAPILVGPLETQTIAARDADGSYELTSNWEPLVERSLSEPFLANIVVSKDGKTGGVIIELQSLQSKPVRDVVHAIFDLVPRYEEQLGGEIYVAGDPVWTVVADDDLDSDSLKLTALMFVLITAILWAFFRDVWLTILPVLAVGGLTIAIHGVLALLSFPMTSILAALPPLLVVIAITASIHLITAFLRYGDRPVAEALVQAADEVGPGCLWASFTTAAGFALTLHHGLRETPTAANRVLALLSKMFNLAERWGLWADGTNPCRHVEHFPERRRERFLSDDELARLGRVLDEVEQGGTESAEAIAAIRLLRFTGCRVSEVLGLRWEDVDVERRCLRFPDSKTGAKRIPLNTAALAVLDGLARLSPWVIPGRDRAQPLVNLAKPWDQVRGLAELDGVRLHDLRHTHGSSAAGAGLSLHLVGALLGHRQPATTARYAHLADDPVHEASERVGVHLASAMTGSNRNRPFSGTGRRGRG